MKSASVRQRNLAALGVIWLALICGGAADPVRGGDETQTITLDVLTLNAWHGLRRGESNKRFEGEDPQRAEIRFAWQIEEIQRLEPDVILMQEVNPNQRQARKYAAALGYDEIHKVTSCGLHLGKIYKIPRNMNEGLAILARPGLKLKRVGKKRLSGNAACTASWGIQTKESRYVLLGRIRMAGREILLATTHLAVPPLVPDEFEETIARLVADNELEPEQGEEILAVLDARRLRNEGEAEKLLRWLDRCRDKLAGKGPAPPMVLAGDFNVPPQAKAISVVREQFTIAAEGPGFLTMDPLTNHVNYAIGTTDEDPLPTFDNAEVREMVSLRKTTARQIDYIFVSEEFDVESADMVLDRPRDGIYPSDHFAILATVRLRADGK